MSSGCGEGAHNERHVLGIRTILADHANVDAFDVVPVYVDTSACLALHPKP